MLSSLSGRLSREGTCLRGTHAAVLKDNKLLGLWDRSLNVVSYLSFAIL